MCPYKYATIASCYVYCKKKPSISQDGKQIGFEGCWHSYATVNLPQYVCRNPLYYSVQYSRRIAICSFYCTDRQGQKLSTGLYPLLIATGLF